MVFFFCDVYNILVIYLWMDDGNYYMLILDRDKYFKISKIRSVHATPHRTKGTCITRLYAEEKQEMQSKVGYIISCCTLNNKKN